MAHELYSTLRCTADHQREAEYPFLDEQVVTYLQQLPMSVKVQNYCAVSCMHKLADSESL